MTSHANGGQRSPSERKAKARRKSVKIQWDGSKTVAANATEKLPELATAFFAMGRAVDVKNPSLHALHRFRLCAKRFRYALELFQPCYGPGLERRIAELRAVQDRLGAISDCAATEELLKERSDLRAADRAKMIRNLRPLTAERVGKFQRHWLENFAPPAVEGRWITYLTRYAGAARR